jgi:hypothetical protein
MIPENTGETFGRELYGKLAAIAKQYLAKTATSVPSELLFSQAGFILTA